MGVIIPQEIPEHITIFHAGYIENAVLEYFTDPVHQREFKEWQERRNHEKEMGICNMPDHSDLGGGIAKLEIGTRGRNRRGSSGAPGRAGACIVGAG